jgi:hypothetical protein
MDDSKNGPMGVSNWINHGKKYGYFDFAVGQATNTTLRKFAEELKVQAAKDMHPMGAVRLSQAIDSTLSRYLKEDQR